MTTRVLDRAVPQSLDADPEHNHEDVCGPCHSEPHAIEQAVLQELLRVADVKYSSLEVHRTANSVCLSGVVRVPEGGKIPEIEHAACRAAGILHVVNCLVMRTLESPNQ